MRISIVGTGPGTSGLLTQKAKKHIEEGDIFIGAERLTEAFASGKTCFNIYKPEEVLKRIKDTGIGKNVVLLLSGDPGFYSSAKKILKLLDNDTDIKGQETAVIPGISSMQYFCENLHLSWENVFYTSLHGRKTNIIGHIRDHRRVFTLLGSGEEIRETAEKLHYYRMDQVKIMVGSRLSYPDEKVMVTDPAGFLSLDDKDRITDRLSVALFINNKASDEAYIPIPDDSFIRGSVPMTKEEIRTVSLSKLRLNKDSVLYDIGAGTGSISVEAALRLKEGEVYAVEKNSDAINLIKENKRKFIADNINIINGSAPECLHGLPFPTHAFIGGSSGRLREIIASLLEMSPGVRIVLNAVSLETLSKAEAVSEEFGLKRDIVLINTARAGDPPLMMLKANNPVFVLSLEKQAEDKDCQGMEGSWDLRKEEKLP